MDKTIRCTKDSGNDKKFNYPKPIMISNRLDVLDKESREFPGRPMLSCGLRQTDKENDDDFLVKFTGNTKARKCILR